MHRTLLPFAKRWCRWQNDREFCASSERHHLRLGVIMLLGLLALNVISAIHGRIMRTISIGSPVAVIRWASIA